MIQPVVSENHPLPEEARIIRADEIVVGDYLYSPAGWYGGPSEYNGCWRRVITIRDAKSLEGEPSTRDLCVELEKFSTETQHLVGWYDRHTLVILRR